MNHVRFQERFDFVRTLLQDRYTVKVLNVEPIEYEAECPFDYNNFIYKLHVDCYGSHQRDLQPGTTSLPLSTSHIIVRLSNAASGLPNHNRVENEVGMMLLFRQALASHDLGDLIPQVYAWGSAENDQGWILQEFKQGSQLDGVFETASDRLKQLVMTQMTDIVYAIQTFKIPQTVTGFGGVSFSSTGKLVSGPMTMLSEGPFHTHTKLNQAFFKHQLTSSDKSPILRGWQDHGIRARLDQFCDEILPGMASTFELSDKAIVHSDFTMNNMLVNESTGRLTALLDFDWSFVGSLHDEFLRSFCDIGVIPGPDSKGEELMLRQSLLSAPSDQPKVEQPNNPLQRWYQILKTRDVQVPFDLTGMDEASQLHWLVSQICPWLLTHEVPLKRRSN